VRAKRGGKLGRGSWGKKTGEAKDGSRERVCE